MRFPAICTCILTITLVALTGCSEKSEPAKQEKPGTGISSEDAALVGTTVSTIVELSDMYVSPETYDLKIAVAEIVRGEACVEVLKKFGKSGVQAKQDSEPVLARVRFEYKARGAPGDKPWEVKGMQFSAFSEDRKPYEEPAILTAQTGRGPVLRSGDVLECWLSLNVAKGDRKPVVIFNPGTSWFRLY